MLVVTTNQIPTVTQHHFAKFAEFDVIITSRPNFKKGSDLRNRKEFGENVDGFLLELFRLTWIEGGYDEMGYLGKN